MEPVSVVAPAQVMFVDPLQDLSDIQAAVHNLAMARQLATLNIQQAITKKQNAMLLVSTRKTRVDETIGKLSNPMSVRAVRLNFRILFMVEDMLSVFKPDGAALLPADLDTMKDISAAAVIVLEEIVRLLQ